MSEMEGAMVCTDCGVVGEQQFSTEDEVVRHSDDTHVPSYAQKVSRCSVVAMDPTTVLEIHGNMRASPNDKMQRYLDSVHAEIRAVVNAFKLPPLIEQASRELARRRINHLAEHPAYRLPSAGYESHLIVMNALSKNPDVREERPLDIAAVVAATNYKYTEHRVAKDKAAMFRILG